MRALSRPPDCLSDLVLDEWLAGELEPEALRSAEEHLRVCARCRARREALLAGRGAFLEQAPTFRVLATRLGKAPRSLGGPQRAWLAAAGAALVAALGLVVFRPDYGSGLEPPITRSKGVPSLGFFVLRGERVSRGASGVTVYPGDRLRFTYSTDRSRHLAVIDLDPAGATVFFPEGPRAVQVHAGQDVALDFSVELDEQLGEERVHAVFCPEPFELEPLRAALARRAEPSLAQGCTVDVIVVRKAARP